MSKDAKGHGSNKRGTIAQRADKAKANQRADMESAKKSGDKMAEYWAGSATNSVMHHYKAGAVRDSKNKKGPSNAAKLRAINSKIAATTKNRKY